MQDSNLDDILTVEEVAKYLKVTKIFVYKLIDDKKIDAYKISRKMIRIPKKSVQDYLTGVNNKESI